MVFQYNTYNLYQLFTVQIEILIGLIRVFIFQISYYIRNFIGEDEDYTSGPYNVTFRAGKTTTLLSVPINNDTIFEGNENFMLNIDSSSLPSDVTFSNPSQVAVTIVEDDGK